VEKTSGAGQDCWSLSSKSKYHLKFKSSQKPNTDDIIRSNEKLTEEVII